MYAFGSGHEDVALTLNIDENKSNFRRPDTLPESERERERDSRSRSRSTADRKKAGHLHIHKNYVGLSVSLFILIAQPFEPTVKGFRLNCVSV